MKVKVVAKPSRGNLSFRSVIDVLVCGCGWKGKGGGEGLPT